MLRIRRRAAVSAGEDFAALRQAMHHVARGLFNRRGKGIACIQVDLSRVLKVAGYSVE